MILLKINFTDKTSTLSKSHKTGHNNRESIFTQSTLTQVLNLFNQISQLVPLSQVKWM